MSRGQIAMRLLAVGIFAAAGASGPAHARDTRNVRPEENTIARLHRWDACGAPPDRMVPSTAAMLGKPVTLAIAPLDVLAVELKLDDGQKKRIKSVQDKLEKSFKDSSKGPHGGDPMDAMNKMGDLISQADKEIEAELTAEQKPLSVELLKKLSTLRTAGVPPEVYLELKPTADQMKALEEALPEIKQENKNRSDEMLAAARSHNFNKMRSLQFALGDKVSAILTKDQKSLVEKYRKKHPQTMMPGMDFGGGL